mmetsp:Transcript_21372/g.47324  ORF Transcript_21372/g.47324 Transcript_21372/m.47324 type:complete len:372 (+) Transcript_21372:76-1191(+)|eukprot:CAMPEP_0170599296 /NCGR_PEP_ID=MMETSP0224-20130122/16717_1 /TAXON_ID=285029 /ORGANISM="Togula jolla, Strain CCCM 725" /LENGTH=371 /DNA_ID=CAMNT_0010923929 /DNA_START=75 /DNA_END=1190 /DNA_ORIENTATION=-
MAPRCTTGRGTARRAAPFAVLLAAAVVLLELPSLRVKPAVDRSLPSAISLPELDILKGKSRSKLLFSYREYELWLKQKRNQMVPRLKVRKTPPKPVTVKSVSSSVEGLLGKELMGFPFTTTNDASVQLSFPRIGGLLSLGMTDPPASLDAEAAPRGAQASYRQTVPHVGDVSAQVRSDGEWSTSVDRPIEDLGTLHATFNSQRDWSADLEKGYSPYKGVTPTVTYGATQDGMHVRLQMDGQVTKNLEASYALQNPAGQYSPVEFLHDCKLTLSTSGKGQSLTARGSYDHRLPKLPVRGSLTYVAKIRQATLEGSADFDSLQLRCRLPNAQMATLVDRRTLKPAAIELGIGKVSAVAKMVDNKPRIQLGFTS